MAEKLRWRRRRPKLLLITSRWSTACEDTDSSDSSKIKKECDYGERCYRKNPTHFEEYEHKHLNKLLERLEKTGQQALPDDYKPKISRETIKEQLNILRSFKPPPASLKTQSGSNIPQANSSPSGTSPSQRKRHITSETGTKVVPLKKRITANHTSAIEGKATSSKQRVETDTSDRNKGKQNNMSNSSSATLTSEQHRKKMQSAQNMSEAMKYFQEVKNRSQGSICEKHKAAAPYYFFLTSVTDSKETHSEPLTLQLFDILDPSLGDLESSLQINFMVEFGWLMAQYHIAGQRGKPLTLLYGEMDVANLSFPFITALNVKPPSPFGSHHTKMCVMAYSDGSVRVCVHTANLVESDWDNRVQGVWLSPLCPALPADADSAMGESSTNFKHDLLQYLNSYGQAVLQPWMGKLRRADFSKINVFFVASTPGSHKGVDSDRWGHAKLGSLLKKHVQIMPKNGTSPSSWQIITQCSSIGSLGPQPTSWFCGEIKQTMSGGLGQALQNPPPIKLVYPSFQNVASSHDGLLGGGCLPYSRKTHEKQPWLNQYLFQWKSDRRHRSRAMPHIKTYTRVSPDLSELAWFHLTSANMSKAAWGTRTKAGAVTILSYEAGVLFLPKFVVGSTTFPIKNPVGETPTFPMPYDLPLTSYTSSDVPWFMDNLS